MIITYTWNCKTVDVHPLEGGESDVVYNVHWNLKAVSDQKSPQPPIPSGEPQPENQFYSASSYGTQGLDVSDITSFIPFADLTEAQVEAWTEAAMGEEQVASLKAGLDAQIEQEINPSSVQMQIGAAE